MTKKIYLETLKSVLGRYVFHYLRWLKNIYLIYSKTQKSLSNFKCQKILRKIKPNIRTIWWIMQLKIKFTQRSHNTSLSTDYLMMWETQVSLSPRLVCPLSYVIRSEQICKTIDISLFLYINKEVSGVLSGMAYFLFNSIICDMVLLFRKNSLWASISLITNQNILVFTYE